MRKIMLSAGICCAVGLLNGFGVSDLDPVETEISALGRVSYYGGEAFENEPFLFIRLWRDLTNELQAVEYATSGGSAIPGVDYLATVRIVRTGSTEAQASTRYQTRDLTARAGRDYLPQSGTVLFPPLISAVTVEVPLLTGSSPDAVAFELELSDPSPGYTNTVPVQVRIWPDLHIRPDSLQKRSNGTWELQIDGLSPMRYYLILGTRNFRNRQMLQVFQSGGYSAVIECPHPFAGALSDKAQFLTVYAYSTLWDAYWP